jgi:nucleotide-binding universal stress UspA family protein
VIRLDRILCPVDLAPFSRRALEQAALLARLHEAELFALYVAPLPSAPLGFLPDVPRGLDASQAEHVERELLRFTASGAGGMTLRSVVRSGEPSAEILQYAGEIAADLIVMGTHGRTGFDRLMLGSVAEKVLHKAACPVLTVPRQALERGERTAFARIVCGVDFSKASDRAAAYALALSQEAEGELLLLHVVEPPPAETFDAFPQLDPASYSERVAAGAQRRLESLISDESRNWCRSTPLLGCGKAYREILRVAEQERADLVVLGVHGHGAVDRLLFGSTTERVVRQSGCPVLTIR